MEESVIIGNTFNFWRYSHENGFDLTRQNDDQRCSPLSIQTTTTPILIDPKRSALVIVDMQNFFLHPAVRDHSTGLAASNKLLEYAIPAARKAGIQIIWLNWGLTEEDIDQAPPGLKRIFGRGLLNEPWHVQTSSKTIYSGFGTEMGDILLPNGEHVSGGRLLMRDSWNAKLYDPLFESYASSQETEKPDQWFHKVTVLLSWKFFIYYHFAVHYRIVYLACGLISLRCSHIFKITKSRHSFSLVLILTNVFPAHFKMPVVKVLIAFYYAMDVEQPVRPLLENALNTIVPEEEAS